ncbi:9940_t:CDS:1 [Scutellospora calospora]|uniref:9940_t:CDS:1 n=1 Tax=Scutellospora calospora TaxID=85575 RepID=A0ACA9KKT0_9GLOM|nr:9940_t:CDS:1 [Scutellospora calospora]
MSFNENWPNNLEKEFGCSTPKENNQIKNISGLSLSDLNNKIEQDLNEMNNETMNNILSNYQEEKDDKKYFEIKDNENKKYLQIENTKDFKKIHSFSLFVGSGYITFIFFKEEFLKHEIRRIVKDIKSYETYEEVIRFDELNDEDILYSFESENNTNIRPFTFDNEKRMIFHSDIKSFKIFHKGIILYDIKNFMDLFN